MQEHGSLQGHESAQQMVPDPPMAQQRPILYVAMPRRRTQDHLQRQPRLGETTLQTRRSPGNQILRNHGQDFRAQEQTGTRYRRALP